MSERFEIEFMRRREKLLPARVVLLVVDIQERLAAAMPPAILEQTIKNTTLLVQTCGQLVLPIIVSQQYPKGLGQTVPALADAIAAAEANGAPVYRFDKTEFSVTQNETFHTLQPATMLGGMMQREQWIVTGMETHVCVYQSARDLIIPTCAVHVVSDAVASRTKANWKIGIDLCRESGTRITSTEVVVFDLLQRAGTDAFKTLSKLIK
jgi:isochorismate hydrolase